MTATLTGPDVHNRYRIHTDRMTVLFFIDPDDDPPGTGCHTRVFVDPAVAEAHDDILAALAQSEREMQYRGTERGVDGFVDDFYDQLNARYVAAFQILAAEAVANLVSHVADDLTGDVAKAIEKATFDKNACWDGWGCRCTPGIILGAAIFHRHMKIRIEVNPPSEPETGEIPAALLDELTEYAIDGDGLDITLDDARDGHHRATVYRELARRAYAAGRASVR